MSLTTRLEKLRFIVDELQLGFFLTQYAPDDFAARTLARHVLIRAKDLVEHARGLKRPLNAAGHNTRQFNEAKEVYAKNFDEYFAVGRDRLSAHLQDFDFGKRLELWNDIEIVKLSFFVDGGKEIFDRLSDLKGSGIARYFPPADLKDAELERRLQEFR
jgi:hypothetical protein